MKTAIISISVILRLLYSTGMCVSKALYTRGEDANLDSGYIHLRKTKNRCERLIPIDESMVIVLKQYIEYRNEMPIEKISHPNYLLLTKLDGTSFRVYALYVFFYKLLKIYNILYVGNQQGPRAHDLRRTFAAHPLVRMERNGVDLYTGLPIPSVCLGYRSLSSTEKYV